MDLSCEIATDEGTFGTQIRRMSYPKRRGICHRNDITCVRKETTSQLLRLCRAGYDNCPRIDRRGFANIRPPIRYDRNPTANAGAIGPGVLCEAIERMRPNEASFAA